MVELPTGYSNLIDHSASGDNVWTTADGLELLWKDMSVPHLRNASRMLERMHDKELEEAYSMLCMVRGEAATDAIEQGIRQLEHGDDLQTAKEMMNYANWRENQR